MMPCPPALLVLQSVARPPLLQSTSLQVQAGDCHAIMGASGSGKSLLLRQVADLDDGMGDVSLVGTARSSMHSTEWRKQVAYCQPEPGWWADHVYEHFPAANAELNDMLSALGLRADILDAAVDSLSSGERQRLGLIRSLLHHPKVLLLDEPTASLDEQSVCRVESVLVARRDAGCALLLVTHDERQAQRLASHGWLMKNGRLEPAWE